MLRSITWSAEVNMVNAIILAGGQGIKGLEESGSKALYRINGKMMIEYVIDVLKEVEDVNRIVVVGPCVGFGDDFNEKVDKIINSDGTIMENIVAGLEYLGHNENVIICTCDIPLITKEAVVDFIKRSEMTYADLCYPIVKKEINDEKYPDMVRTYVKLKEGKYTGGNVFYLKPEIILKNYDFGQKLISYRKEPIKMARLLGLSFMIKFLAGRITVEMVEKKFFQITGIRGKAIISSYPEIGQDVDKTGDLYAAVSYLSSRG